MLTRTQDDVTVGRSATERQDPARQVAQPNAEHRVKLMRGKEVEKTAGIGRSTRYAKLDPKNAAYDPAFPLPIRIGANTVRWIESEIDAYIASRPRTRNREGGTK